MTLDADKASVALHLMTAYLLWSLAALTAFILFVGMAGIFILSDAAGLVFLFGILLSGFLWLGATALSRHSLVRLKNYIGRKIGTAEFLATQFIVFIFPFYYFRVKREVDRFVTECTDSRSCGGQAIIRREH